VPEPNACKFDFAIGKLERYKLPGVDYIRAKVIQAGGEALHSGIRKVIMLIWNKGNFSNQWKSQLSYLFTKRVIKLTGNYQGISFLLMS
jgi:hypothetical protein